MGGKSRGEKGYKSFTFGAYISKQIRDRMTINYS